MSRENVELVRVGYEAWNRGDMDAMLAIFHPDVELVTTGVFPGLDPAYRGHDGFRKFWRDFRGTWASLSMRYAQNWARQTNAEYAKVVWCKRLNGHQVDCYVEIGSKKYEPWPGGAIRWFCSAVANVKIFTGLSVSQRSLGSLDPQCY